MPVVRCGKTFVLVVGLVGIAVLSFVASQNQAANFGAKPSVDEVYLGEIRMVPYAFAPKGWASCDGQLLTIASNPALFSLLGTTYGGDGRTTFALPDLRGRCPVHTGKGPGTSNVRLGSKGGGQKVKIDTESREVTQPYASVRFIIATKGQFPSR